MSNRNEGLHGVGGWLALLVAGMLVLGPLLAIGRTYGEFASAERMYPGLTQLAEWSSFKTVGWVSLLIFCAISIYGGLGLATKRTPDAVSRAKWILWFNYPLSIVVTAMIIPTVMIPGGGKEAAMAIPSLLASLIAVAIWTAYLNRSKRVQNTYGLGDESPVVQVSAAAYQVSGSKNPECAVPTKTDGGQHALPLPPNRDATKTIPTTDYQATIDKDHVYRQIAEELETGATDKGLWIRLFAECGGDEKQTKVLYIKQRAVRLIAAERLRLEKTARDKTAQTENLEQVQREASDIADPRKEISEAEILNEEAANEEAHFFDKNIYRDNLLEQGCSKEAIDYLKNPIHIYSYMQKYKKTEEKILDAIKKGNLRGCYVGEALWVENKKI